MTAEAPIRAPAPTIGEAGTGFGLYVHWPFCQAKCPYCDFNSHVVQRIDQARWAAALVSEVRRVAALTRERELTSVFFGGGTPSTMTAETVGAVMEAIGQSWTCAADLEVSLEANPTSVDAARFTGYRAAGVTRLSLGVQALNDIDLKRLGRLHSAQEARAAFGVARETFERVSFDLICARQDQSAAAWRTELREALALAADHLSLYQLTIEPGTVFAARHARGRLLGLPDEELGADLYEITVDACEASGLALYEVSNFARPGAECRHNLLYWSGGDYAGIGPGAHGRLTLGRVRQATEQVAMPGPWLAAVEEGRMAHEESTALAPPDQAYEYIMMGLRKKSGLNVEYLGRIAALPEHFWTRAMDLEHMGMLRRSGPRLRVTSAGRLLLNRIVADLTEW
ncbi:MAG: radical SAM family heme chaperone HemW [Pseudomonadota bacterium]